MFENWVGVNVIRGERYESTEFRRRRIKEKIFVDKQVLGRNPRLILVEERDQET